MKQAQCMGCGETVLSLRKSCLKLTPTADAGRAVEGGRSGAAGASSWGS